VSFRVDGAWARKSVSIGGSEPFEMQRVCWLQAGSAFADLRVPFLPGAAFQCFAGRAGWDGDRFRWSHRLDLEAGGGEDVGELAWDNGRLIERGWLGDVRYEEVWERQGRDDGPSLAAEGPHACLVQAGRHSISVVDQRDRGGEFAACYRVLGAAGWHVRDGIGDTTSLPSPDAVPPAWRLLAVTQ
jgi:hypothetical protein